jgi:hypothetical protein
LGPEGGAALAGGLTALTGLQKLDLRYGGVGAWCGVWACGGEGGRVYGFASVHVYGLVCVPAIVFACHHEAFNMHIDIVMYVNKMLPK